VKLYEELKRRNVLRVGAAYLVGSWLLLQIIDVVGPILHLPESFARYLLFLLIVGLLPALIFAWVFELTPQGVRRESEVDPARSTTRYTGRRLDRAIIVTLALAVSVLLFDRLVLDGTDQTQPASSTATSMTGAPTADERRPAAAPAAGSVAVLPFVAMSSGPDDDYFTDGLTEEIINALAQVPDLLVTARTSAFHFKGQNLPIADIAVQLGVAHIVEGSVRRAGDQLRITAQLIRAADGFHVWSETYDRRTEDTFAVQTDIAEQVARALNVFLDDALRERMQQVGTRNVEAFIAFQKGVELYERAHREPNQISLLRQANVHFDRVIETAPELFQASVYHGDLFSHMLISTAAGQVNGEISNDDVSSAPIALADDYRRASRHAGTESQKRSADFTGTLFFGPWRGLESMGLLAATTNGCEVVLWLHLIGPLIRETDAVLGAFERMMACDPLRGSPAALAVGSLLWSGRADEAIRTAERKRGTIDNPQLFRHLALAYAVSGDTESAKRTVNSQVRTEDERLVTRSMLAAIGGDAAQAEAHQSRYLVGSGPNDLGSLVLEALRGNRGEANRLASLIDARPFGHVALLQAIYFCLCGAPFDLAATPNFAALLEESSLSWPPVKPYPLPLKGW
jgi:TolB-like protein